MSFTTLHARPVLLKGFNGIGQLGNLKLHGRYRADAELDARVNVVARPVAFFSVFSGAHPVRCVAATRLDSKWVHDIRQCMRGQGEC